ncbi:subtilisin-like proprotein convertase family protein [Litoreibacter ponti]|uniref:Subtilisin-like proprotein convertase family protein n=1 Tax=Litoreibacter ponti TaxID=1510457 RepID=A0A2T6BNR5_9RHOB|nr:S8 family serine peptidase [Litoreibacter ponti]PTX57723.1 subtilisin-like proprotein convertase family protein [Litoreibacter ponti]
MVSFSDPLFSSQWHLNLINVRDVWRDYSGEGVVVGVFDDGVDFNHEDLDDNFDARLNIVTNGFNWNPFPNTMENGHGTAVAGLIAAEAGNGRGGVGVAHGATIGAVDVFDDVDLNGLDAERALYHTSNFDIASNSWGYTPLFFELSPYDDFASSIIPAYQNAAEVGRGGLGTVIVQAAGNDTLNVQGSGEHTTRFAITVAATDRNNWVEDYSNYGTGILISAPSGSVTTDISGRGGYANGNYTTASGPSAFGGTSASTPIVSGVIALMLDANEQLGWRDVNSILAMSASQTGSTFGSTHSGFEQGDWFANASGNWNGGGATFHMSYGYGIVDALAAVRMAEAWVHMTDGAATSLNEVSRSYFNGTDVRIPSIGSIESSIMVTDEDIEIDYVNVTVSIRHSYGSNLEAFLVSPSGQEYMLFQNPGHSQTMDYGWTYTLGVAALVGESSLGEWTLRIEDEVSGYSGTLRSFELEFYGTQADKNDIHHFTNDFLEVATVDPDRRTITDTDGGIDWLNMAAVSRNIVADLDQSIQVSAETWVNLTAGQFENIFSGDGNDVLTGSTGANEIHSGRGNDIIYGGGGADTIYGGDGFDRIETGAADDFIFGGDSAADLRDEIKAGAGDDYIDAGYGNDEVYGGAGDDTILGGFGVDRLIGQAGNDVITGSAFSDLIFGGDGDDFVNGGFGSDRINGGNGADDFYHIGVLGHGSDWIQDYDSAEGDVLLFGNSSASVDEFQVNYAETARAGLAGDMEAFVIYRPTGQILWALIDGDVQDEINLQIGGDIFNIA